MALNGQIMPRNRRPMPKEEEKPTKFVDRLWYGGGFGLNFSGGLAGLAGNSFGIGISPMMGYKLTPVFSVGPRAEITYTNGRFRQSGSSPVATYNGIDYGAGVFARAKFLPFLFAHTELSYISFQFPVGFDNNGKLFSERQGDNRLLAGLGYTGGGTLKSEIYVLYDFFNDSQTTNLPLVYRFGLTYRF
jgi:hypothetical protein